MKSQPPQGGIFSLFKQFRAAQPFSLVRKHLVFKKNQQHFAAASCASEGQWAAGAKLLRGQRALPCARVEHFDAHQAPPDKTRGQRARHSFHFGQFRHESLLCFAEYE